MSVISSHTPRLGSMSYSPPFSALGISQYILECFIDSFDLAWFTLHGQLKMNKHRTRFSTHHTMKQDSVLAEGETSHLDGIVKDEEHVTINHCGEVVFHCLVSLIHGRDILPTTNNQEGWVPGSKCKAI